MLPTEGRLVKVDLANDGGPMVIQEGDIHAIESTSESDREELGTDGKSCIYLAPIAVDSSRIFITESVHDFWERLRFPTYQPGFVCDVQS